MTSVQSPASTALNTSSPLAFGDGNPMLPCCLHSRALASGYLLGILLHRNKQSHWFFALGFAHPHALSIISAV